MGRTLSGVALMPYTQPADGTYTLVLKPIEPAIVFEKIVVDYGGYEDSYLFMDESPCRRNKLNEQ